MSCMVCTTWSITSPPLLAASALLAAKCAACCASVAEWATVELISSMAEACCSRAAADASVRPAKSMLAAAISVLVKTLMLYTIMVTGCIWEKEVFGVWLFAHAFFWEDVFSMLVLALHTAYLVMLFGGFGTVEQRMLVALAGYATYLINAGQFLLKLRAARLQATAAGASTSSQTGSAHMAVSA